VAAFAATAAAAVGRDERLPLVDSWWPPAATADGTAAAVATAIAAAGADGGVGRGRDAAAAARE